MGFLKSKLTIGIGALILLGAIIAFSVLGKLDGDNNGNKNSDTAGTSTYQSGATPPQPVVVSSTGEFPPQPVNVSATIKFPPPAN